VPPCAGPIGDRQRAARVLRGRRRLVREELALASHPPQSNRSAPPPSRSGTDPSQRCIDGVQIAGSDRVGNQTDEKVRSQTGRRRPAQRGTLDVATF
jgi:hypothetical protein